MLYQKARCVLKGPWYGKETWVKVQPPFFSTKVRSLDTKRPLRSTHWYETIEISPRGKPVLVPQDNTELLNEFKEIEI